MKHVETCEVCGLPDDGEFIHGYGCTDALLAAYRAERERADRAVEALREAEQQATGRTHDIIARALADIEGADHAAE